MPYSPRSITRSALLMIGPGIASPICALGVAFFACLLQRGAAQAPVNDIVSWPSGMLLLATVLYAGLGNSLDQLWAIDPAPGLFLFTGLPVCNIWGMDRFFWTFRSCHFVSRVRPAVGRQACWVPAESVTDAARQATLKRVEAVLSCVTYIPPMGLTGPWQLRPTGLLYPGNMMPVVPVLPLPNRAPSESTRDYLLFAAIAFHVEWELHTTVLSSRGRDHILFSTVGSPWAALFDVDSVEMAERVVAANMARRQFHESRLRALATRAGNLLSLDIDAIGTTPVCTIDFHSYAPGRAKVSATLRELAESYYVVIQHIKAATPIAPVGRSLARAHCNGALWTAILGGEFLARGRVTVQNLTSAYMQHDARAHGARRRADTLYTGIVGDVLEELQAAQLAGEERATDFDAICDRGGIARPSAGPFLITGVVCQAIVCYFLSVGTSAGVWTSVAMANAPRYLWAVSPTCTASGAAGALKARTCSPVSS